MAGKRNYGKKESIRMFASISLNIIKEYSVKNSKNESDIKLHSKASLKYYMLLLLIWLIVPWFTSSFIRGFLSPSQIDPNAQAYLHLIQAVEAVESETYMEAEELAATAIKLSNDPEIHDLADKIIGVANICMRMNVKTTTEANSLKGIVKGGIKGFLDPSLSLDSTLLIIDNFISDPGTMQRRLTEKYGPVFENYINQERFAAVVGKFLYWILLLGGAVGYLWRKKEIDQSLIPLLVKNR